jgi:hypothetical protein
MVGRVARTRQLQVYSSVHAQQGGQRRSEGGLGNIRVASLSVTSPKANSSTATARRTAGSDAHVLIQTCRKHKPPGLVFRRFGAPAGNLTSMLHLPVCLRVQHAQLHRSREVLQEVQRWLCPGWLAVQELLHLPMLCFVAEDERRQDKDDVLGRTGVPKEGCERGVLDDCAVHNRADLPGRLCCGHSVGDG